MFTTVVLPCAMVNWIILIGNLSKKNVEICCLLQNCKMKLGFYYCVFNCGMFMCRFLEVHPTRLEFINASCNKNRKTFVALYLENEYDEVVVEACFDCKRFDNCISNWPSFQCSSTRFAWRIITFFLITKWWTSAFLQGEKAPKDVRNLGQEWNKGNRHVTC